VTGAATTGGARGNAARTGAEEVSVRLRTEALCKHFPGVEALSDVDFELRQGEIHVLFGENGAGKSTLISLLAGADQPTRGRILVDERPVVFTSVLAARRMGISAVFQEFSLVPQLSVEDNLFLGAEPGRGPFLDKRACRREARAILERLGFIIDPGRPVMYLSRAEQQIVEIAKALRTQPSVLILDEPTASLTERETERLFTLLSQARWDGISIIYITHRMNEIWRIADRITVLRDGRRIGTYAADHVGEERLIELMTGRTISEVFPEVRRTPGEMLLDVERLTTATGGVRDVSLTVCAGEIVGIAGLVGSGKSELVRACFGLAQLASGEVKFRGERVTGLSPRQMIERGFFYLPPDRRAEGLVAIRSVRENVSLPSLDRPDFSGRLLLRRAAERERVTRIARRLNLHPFAIERAVGQFSGGNQQKVLLAKALSREVRLFVLDEPTVGVDVGTRVAIYRFIAELCHAGAGILLVSSDLPEILRLSHRAYVMFRGALRAELDGRDLTEERVLGCFFEDEAA
jgi:ribose transport system ATP-binding protein